MLNELPRLEPVVAAGEVIHCPRCFGRHLLRKSNDPHIGDLLLFYSCDNVLRLGAVAGKSVVSV